MSGHQSMEEVLRELEEERRLRRQAQRERNEAQEAKEAERAAKEAERAAKEAERAAKEAERAAKEAERAAKEAAEKAIEQTTLKEYLRYCHFHLFEALDVQSDKTKTTGGGTTAVDGKYYPFRVLPWKDFIQNQRENFKILEDVLGDERLFDPEVGIKITRKRACGSPVGCEEDIKPFEFLAIEGPVKDIIYALFAKTTNPKVLPFKVSRISFTNNTLTIRPEEIGSREMYSEEVQSGDIPNEEIRRRQRQSEPNKEDMSKPQSSIPVKPDRFCVCEDLKGKRTAAFVIEYKAAHKVPVEDLRRALRKETLCTEAAKRARSSKTSLDSEDKADQLVAMIMTQTFDYMINWGLEYGYFTAGRSLVFLRVNFDDPKTVYYYMIAPSEGEDESQLDIFSTAVAQVASFCLMALQSTRQNQVPLMRQSQAYQDKVYKKLQKWPHPYPEVSDESTDEEESSSSQASKTTTSSIQSFVKSPSPDTNLQNYQLRSKSSCREPSVIRDNNNDDNDNDDDDTSRDTPRAAPSGTRPLNEQRQSESRSSTSGNKASSETKYQTRQYCTQRCLLGLRRGWTLDENCPNVSLHRTPESSTRHRINVTDFTRLVREQLGQDRDRDCEPLDKYGARGVLFKLTLARYGYTFVGKGTLSVFVRILQYEGSVYGRLERLQGEVVPVYLGNIDLIKPYYLPGAHIVHMLLMSWAGEKAAEAGLPDLAEQVQQTSQAVRGEGVVHNDEREDNILWNDERRRVMLIDFERSSVLPAPKHKQLLKLSSQKRKRQAKDAKIYHQTRILG